MRFTAIDLSELPPPSIIIPLDVEAAITKMRDGMVARFPACAGVIDLETEPLRKAIEEHSYRATLHYALINDGTRANLLASSWGSNLDHVVALLGVSRGTMEDAEGNLVEESDARLRGRAQLAPDAMSTAGPPGAYIYHAMTQAPWARNASAIMTKPGRVRVTILREGADPQPSKDELFDVRSFLLSEDVVPLTDMVEVIGPKVTSTSIVAKLTLYPGPDGETVKNNALLALNTWLETNRLLGMNLRRSAIISRLHAEGVHSVDLIEPATDIILDDTEAYAIKSVTATVEKLRDQ